MKSITAQCPTCGADRNAQVIAEHEVTAGPTEEPFDPTLRGAAYRILKCAGCDTIYFQRESLQILSDESDGEFDFDELKNHVLQLREYDPSHILDEETSYWPAPRPKLQRPDWHKLSDSILVSLLDSVYTALEHDLRVLAAIGMRVVFERAGKAETVHSFSE